MAKIIIESVGTMLYVKSDDVAFHYENIRGSISQSTHKKHEKLCDEIAELVYQLGDEIKKGE